MNKQINLISKYLNMKRNEIFNGKISLLIMISACKKNSTEFLTRKYFREITLHNTLLFYIHFVDFNTLRS